MKFALILSLYVLTCARDVLSQTAELRGRVHDQSGALVAAATVTLSGETGISRSCKSDSAGGYDLAGIPPGTYSVVASAPNLTQKESTAIILKPGLQTLDLQLAVSDLTQHVTVQANSGSGISTESAENTNSLTLRGADLDALADDPDDLQADLQALAGPSAGPSGGSMYIDGFSGGELPPKSAIREIRINQNPFSPEYDKLGYGRIDIFTKPGSDKYRATVQYNLGTDWWNSRNPYSSVKAPLLLNEFEGEGGGPLGKKASLSITAQRNTVDNGSVTNGVDLAPNTLAITPFNTIVTAHQALTRVSPRVDYQLNANNTLTIRYGITDGGIQNAGVGAFELTSRGYHVGFNNQTAQIGETAVMGNIINEVRFQYFREDLRNTANSNDPQLLVLGAFNGGGSSLGQSRDTQNSYELQNYTSVLKGAHSIKFGVRLRSQYEDSLSPVNFNGAFTFTNIDSYQKSLLYSQAGYSPEQIRAMGAGAAQFSITTGLPELRVSQLDGALFIGDEWRVRPNVTLNLGARYEAQTNIHDWKDIAPRVGIAWAPPATHGKMVIRAGFGTFYERFALADTLTARRFNGAIQQQYVVTNPDFFPLIPSNSQLAAGATSQVVQEVSAQLRAPYILQSAFSVERQLPGHSTMAVTYTNSRGLHQLRSTDINAPLPGTYNPNLPQSGVYPLSTMNPVFLMESSGVYNQNQLIANVNGKISGSVSFFGFYVFSKAMSNTDGVGTFPANPYNYSGEYGPAATDVRHRFAIGGSLSARWNIRLSPFVLFQTGTPFDITSGSDYYGTTLFNARPGFATDPSRPGLISTSYGLLDPNPSPSETIVPRNYGRGPDSISFNVRFTKTIGFGPERSGGGSESRGSESGNLNPLNAASGRGIGGLLGTTRTSYRYNLTFGLSARNILNHVNPGPVIGTITSPLFGESNQLGAPRNGEGFSENASNRRLELQIKFAF
ncbi:MAG TPA: carboxypeptidase regulatory-like domain-containing protein [Bryobacteraceae bacterium]|nr:carboxypeptidase regulatory-like domain-containing protein [Bryobacteraceae bacterium]